MTTIYQKSEWKFEAFVKYRNSLKKTFFERFELFKNKRTMTFLYQTIIKILDNFQHQILNKIQEKIDQQRENIKLESYQQLKKLEVLLEKKDQQKKLAIQELSSQNNKVLMEINKTMLENQTKLNDCIKQLNQCSVKNSLLEISNKFLENTIVLKDNIIDIRDEQLLDERQGLKLQQQKHYQSRKQLGFYYSKCNTLQKKLQFQKKKILQLQKQIFNLNKQISEMQEDQTQIDNNDFFISFVFRDRRQVQTHNTRVNRQQF